MIASKANKNVLIDLAKKIKIYAKESTLAVGPENPNYASHFAKTYCEAKVKIDKVKSGKSVMGNTPIKKGEDPYPEIPSTFGKSRKANDSKKTKERREILEARKKYISKLDIFRLIYDACALDFLFFKMDYRMANEKKLEKVINLRAEKVRLLADSISDALERSIRSEAAYAFRSRKVASLEDYGTPVNCAEKDCLFEDFGWDFWGEDMTFDRVSLDKVQIAFYAKIWGRSFGGPLWGKAADGLMKLNKAIEKEDTGQMLLYADHILDMQHNTGFILNKTEWRVLDEQFPLYPVESGPAPMLKGRRRRNITHLDNRSILRSLEDFKPYVTKKVRNLISANCNYLV